MDAVTADELAGMLACGCGKSDCNKVAEWLHAKCHIEAGLDVKFADGAIELYCHTCKTLGRGLIFLKKKKKKKENKKKNK